MNAGGAYALVLDAAPVKTSLMIGSLRAALKEAIPCLLVLSSASDVSSTKALALWGEDLTQTTQDETLRVFTHEQDFKSNLFRYGINRFIQDLELLKPQNKSYIWFDHAEQLFALQDMHFATRQLKILKDWLQARDITATFVFAKLNSTETHDIHLLSEDLAGLCRITGGSKGLEARFLHWQSPDGAISHKNYGLVETASGFYHATLAAQGLSGSGNGNAVGDSQTVQDATPLFINLDPSVKASLDSGSIKWQFLDSPLSLLHAVRGSVTPTVVLRFGQDTSIRQLAETVHTLRTVVGRGAKIIVHEDAFSLRFNYESLLMRLGANFIMHRDVPYWRLSRVIDSLEGTRFDRAVDVDFSELVSGAFPSELSGLVSVGLLVDEIESILLKTKLNNLPKALLTGLVVPSRDAEDILSKVHMDREGDLFAFEGQTIYIFLSACPPSHVTETIERKLKDSLAAVFGTTSIWTQTTDIAQQLLQLKHRIVIKPTVLETATAEPIILPDQNNDSPKSTVQEKQTYEHLTSNALQASADATSPIEAEVLSAEIQVSLTEPLSEQTADAVSAAVPEAATEATPELVSEAGIVSEPKPEVESEVASEVESEVASEVASELKLEILPEVAASIAEQEVAIVRTARQPTTYSGAVVRSPFKVDQVDAMVLPTDSILSGSEPNTPEQDVTHVYIESVTHDVEVESPAVEVESPAVEVESPAVEPALVHHFPDPMSVKFKPLVFLKSRSESDAPIE